MVVTQRRRNATVITLLPNRSASWTETRLFIFLLSGTTLAVGVLWAVAGAWMVLPFSGIEAGLASYFIYRVCQRSYRRQVVTCCGDVIVVETGARFPQRRWQFSKPDTRLAVSEPRHSMDVAELCIFDRQKRVELGYFLNASDKHQALCELRQEGLHIRTYDKSTEPM